MRHFGLLLLGTLAFAACSPFDSSPPGNGGTPTSAGIKLKLTNSQAMTAATSRSVIGQTDALGLESYQVAIASIQLITDATVTGTGWSNPLQSVTLYENNVAINDGTAADPSTPGFVDLLDPVALASFSSSYSLTTADAGTYQYLVINYAPYVRFKGSVSLSDATKLYSKSGGSFIYSTTAAPLVPSTGQGWFTNDSSADFSAGPSELATVKIGSGGSIMKFAKPLTITADDLANGVQLKLMMVFDPVGAITASKKSPDGSGGYMIGGDFYDSLLDSFAVGIPNMGALVSAEGKTVVMETYSATIHETKSDGSDRSTNSLAWNSQWFKQRIEIYSLADDPGTILSVSLTNLIEPASKNSPASSDWVSPQPVASPMYFTTSADGKLSMQDYQHVDQVGLLTRLTTVGQTGSADFTYSSTMDPDPSVSQGYSAMIPKTESLTYSLDSIRTLTN